MPSQFMDEHEMNGTTIPVEKVLFKPLLSNVQPMWHSSLSMTTGIDQVICWNESFFQRRFNGDFLIRGHRAISLAMWSSEGRDVVSSGHVESEHLPIGRPSTTFRSNETISRTGKYGELPSVWHERDHYCRVWNLTIVFPISNTCFNASTVLFLPKMSCTINFSPPMQKVKSSERCLFTRVIDRILLSLVLCSVWKMNMNNHRLKNGKCGEIHFEIVMSTATRSSQQINLLLRNRPSLFGKTRVMLRTNNSLCVFVSQIRILYSIDTEIDFNSLFHSSRSGKSRLPHSEYPWRFDSFE